MRASRFLGTAAVVLGVLAGSVPAHAEGIWVQQYARAQGASCADGYGQSWAQWPNNGTGGFVCNRYVQDPSANSILTQWLFWANLGPLSNGATASTPTPWCSAPGSSAHDPIFGVRLDGTPAGVSVTLSGNLTVIDNQSGSSLARTDLWYLCQVGKTLHGVV